MGWGSRRRRWGVAEGQGAHVALGFSRLDVDFSGDFGLEPECEGGCRRALQSGD